MNLKFYPWIKDDEDESFAWITQDSDFILNCMDSYLLYEGVSVQSWFPTDTVFHLDDSRGIKLTDSIPNLLHLLIISSKLKGLLEQHSDAAIEFLPVNIRNHKGRLIKEPYFIANLLGTVDCVDPQKSRSRPSVIRPDQVFRFYRLALDPEKIPPAAKIFRLKELPSLVVVRDDLADDILHAGCDGMIFQEMDDFGSEWGELHG